MDNRTILAVSIIFILFLTMVIIAIITWVSMNAQKRSMLHIMKLYDDLRKSDTRLRSAVNMEKSFIRNLNHEIRTPLNAISGFAQLLCSSELPLGVQEKEDCAKYIIDNVELMTSMLTDMISFSDIENNELKFSKENVSVNELLDSAVKTVKYRVQPSVKISWSSEFGQDFLIETDRAKARQIIINMLTNSCKNTSKGFIRLDCIKDENNKIAFVVTDSGVGVSEDKKEHIFDAFAKGDEFKQGLGLGLTICRMLAEGIQGSIDLDDSYTDGARFVFRVPAMKAS